MYTFIKGSAGKEYSYVVLLQAGRLKDTQLAAGISFPAHHGNMLSTPQHSLLLLQRPQHPSGGRVMD